MGTDWLNGSGHKPSEDGQGPREAREEGHEPGSDWARSEPRAGSRAARTERVWTSWYQLGSYMVRDQYLVPVDPPEAKGAAGLAALPPMGFSPNGQPEAPPHGEGPPHQERPADHEPLKQAELQPRVLGAGPVARQVRGLGKSTVSELLRLLEPRLHPLVLSLARGISAHRSYRSLLAEALQNQMEAQDVDVALDRMCRAGLVHLWIRRKSEAPTQGEGPHGRQEGEDGGEEEGDGSSSDRPATTMPTAPGPNWEVRRVEVSSWGRMAFSTYFTGQVELGLDVAMKRRREKARTAGGAGGAGAGGPSGAGGSGARGGGAGGRGASKRRGGGAQRRPEPGAASATGGPAARADDAQPAVRTDVDRAAADQPGSPAQGDPPAQGGPPAQEDQAAPPAAAGEAAQALREEGQAGQGRRRRRSRRASRGRATREGPGASPPSQGPRAATGRPQVERPAAGRPTVKPQPARPQAVKPRPVESRPVDPPPAPGRGESVCPRGQEADSGHSSWRRPFRRPRPLREPRSQV